MLRILVVGLVALVAAMLMLRNAGRSIETATVLDAPRPLPSVTLTDASGADFSLEDLEGRYTLAFFGFTNCPDVCPLTLAEIARALAGIRAEAPGLAPQVLFVSVDPARDTPDRIRAYLDAFDPSFTGVTADDAALAPLLTALGVSVHKQAQGAETYNVVHNGTIYVLDDAARWVAIFGGSSHRAEVIVNDYLALRALESPE